jgi:ribonuclease Z
MGQDRDREQSPPIDIYGPEGLRMWLRVAIRYSVSRIVPPYRVHELMNVPMAPEWDYNPRTRRYFYNTNKNMGSSVWGAKGLAGEDAHSWISMAPSMPLEPSLLYGEMEGGRSIYPRYDHPGSESIPVWDVEDEDDVYVTAAPMSHGIPCVGYVVTERARPGRLRSAVVEPIVQRNIAALKQAGFAIPMKALAVLKQLAPGQAFTFPDGTVVTHEDAVEPPRAGRKIVICGDTADARALQRLAQNATVVIHEATNAFVPGVDRDTNLATVTRDARMHGHSTPQMAGAFARAVQAQWLVLHHFSARYKGDVSMDSLSIMMRMEQQAMRAAGLNESQVVAAWDFMVLPVPSP